MNFETQRCVAQRMQTAGVELMTAETDERLNVRITNLQNESEVAKVLYVARACAAGALTHRELLILCARERGPDRS
jgi:hypothetical protein